ncbi:FAR1-related sequence 5 [Prunus dulcis]|uniref:Protein FAR1-RELATED SEQUENCE n=1 Tax=Prunus dulcis TaxID=3755 RepID=A0A4Y1RST4_PRUDU|nr:FAR1-related sequence 5 [Prunus dulcis]
MVDARSRAAYKEFGDVVTFDTTYLTNKHRWCLWHIMNKFPSKLNRYKQYEAIMYALQSIVYGSLEKVEFEEGWDEIIEKYELQDNEWLAGLYNERQRWVPCFVKDSFWAGMSTTQRSESMNAFFDDHVNSKTTLKQFVEQYENALKVKVEKEKQEDFKSSSIGFDCGTHYNMEKQAQEVYTISKYKEFHEELIGKMYCDYVSHKVNGANFEYQISEDFMMEGKKKRLYFKVWLNEDDNEVQCNCRMFEFRGILCRHTIYVFLRHNIDLIAEKYIMRRWRKDSHTEAQRCHKMQKAFDEIKELANDSDNKCMIVMTWMDNVKEELSKHNVVCGSDQPNPQSPIGRNIENDVSSIPNPSQCILTPLAARKKGRPPFKRRKSQLEQAVRKKQDSKKKKQESNKKIKSYGNNTNGEKELNNLMNIGHIVGSSTSKGDGVVGTQESIAMQDHQYQYWNEDYNIYMPSFSSGGSGGQRN